MTDNKTLLLQKTIDRALVGAGEKRIAWEKVIYSFDKDIDYSGSTYKLKKSNMIHQDRIETVLLKLFKGGPDWIHSNIIFSSHDFVVITLISGKAVGNPNPSINVSYEKNKTIKIIEG